MHTKASHPHDPFCGDHPESEKFMEEDEVMNNGDLITAPEARTEVVDPLAVSTNVLDMIVRAATNPDVDVEKMERLMTMHDRIVSQRAEAGFNAAMADAQAGMTVVGVDSANPQTRSKYASYAALDRALRPVYTKHGFSLSFDSGDNAPESCIRVLCYVSHRNGHTRTYRADMPSDGKGAKGGDVMTKTHAAGSAFTYGQRYLLKLIFNVATGEVDDDGNAAGGEMISAEQKDRIIGAMRKVGADTKKFLAAFNIESIDALPTGRFDQAIRSIEAKGARG